MPSMTSQNCLNLLVADQSALSGLIDDAIAAAAPLAAGRARTSLLAKLTVVGPFEDFDQDVEIVWRDAAQFQSVRDAWNAGRVRFEVEPLEHASNLTTFADRAKAPRAIFGYCADFVAMCVRRHPDLDRMIVQLS